MLGVVQHVFDTSVQIIPLFNSKDDIPSVRVNSSSAFCGKEPITTVVLISVTFVLFDYC